MIAALPDAWEGPGFSVEQSADAETGADCAACVLHQKHSRFANGFLMWRFHARRHVAIDRLVWGVRFGFVEPIFLELGVFHFRDIGDGHMGTLNLRITLERWCSRKRSFITTPELKLHQNGVANRMAESASHAEPQQQNIDATYWESVAPIYDTLYESAWSIHEDAQTKRILNNELLASVGNRVLDVGCGNGLAYRLLGANEVGIRYTGIDLSSTMIATLKRRHPEVTSILGSADEVLGGLSTASYDLVVAINTAASFPRDVGGLLSSTARLLAPGGRFCLSYLNRNSLRRFVHCAKGAMEIYRTRGDHSNLEGVPANTMSAEDFAALSASKSLECDTIHYQSVFGGLWEGTGSLTLERIASIWVSAWGHSVTFCGTRRAEK